jgi:ribose transport system substrate-binding protein
MFLLCFLAFVLAFGGFSGMAYAAPKNGKGYVIGFSNSYNGNTYRQAMERHAREAADTLIASGELGELIFAESNQNNSVQVQQIQNFIVQDVDAIIVDPGSATALTGAIQEASDAGIPCIIVNDGPVESKAELCYQINFDTVAQMGELTEYICRAIGGKGSIIELRGTAGSEFDNIAHQGVLGVLAKYPDIKVLAEIYTDWTGSKAQAELASVLPTLADKVDAIVTQGGDSYAAVQAFQSAGLELPIIGGDNRGYFLKWWANAAPEGYDTISVSSNPWDGASAVYVAVDILNGMDVPKDMTHPFGVITKDEVKNFADVPDEVIACPTYNRDWVRANLYKK